MIPNHPQFLEAIATRRKVRAKFYSKADSGVIERVCAPMDYGPRPTPPPGAPPDAPPGSDAEAAAQAEAGMNRYWLWDYSNPLGSRIHGLAPEQIVGLHVLTEEFLPSDFGTEGWTWHVPRDWGRPSQTSP